MQIHLGSASTTQLVLFVVILQEDIHTIPDLRGILNTGHALITELSLTC